MAAGIFVLVALAYQSIWHAGFIWDDNGHVTPRALRSAHGLFRIWFEFGATQQYYPVLHSAFWFEHAIWGDAAAAYHWVNLALHSLAAFLFYRVLRELRIPGALLAAIVFAVHPVGVETVAWISEQKNTLSAVFYFSATLAWLRFDRDRRAGSYVLATLLFLLALGSKSVTATLPAALLVVAWWQGRDLRDRRLWLPLTPWFVFAAIAGVVTAWMERAYIGAEGAGFELSPLTRLLIAGRALWFYAGKVVWPGGLTFIYPHWALDPKDASAWLPPTLAIGALVMLFTLRRTSRAPLSVALLFAGTLFPALGFFNVYPFRYSYVADHFQYLASATLIAGLVAALVRVAPLLSRVVPRSARLAAVALIGVLSLATWKYAANFSDPETLWRCTLERNPGCWMAYDNLGDLLLRENLPVEALAEYQRALEAKPDDDLAFNNIGYVLLHAGQRDEAIPRFQRALEINPHNAEAHNNLGVALLETGKIDEARGHFERALEIKDRYSAAIFNLARVRAVQGNNVEAMALFRRGLEIDPDSVRARVALARLLLHENRAGEARAEINAALALEPADGEARKLADAVSAAGGPGR
ncbi:MAG TPA: tetratricopeptide repeat protein [Candidatus Didemnitutus sp.]|nr:tetratricopeptide repeat protein [Candidatus Didemnitutus sp.]